MTLKPLDLIAAMVLLPLCVRGAEAPPPAAPLPHAHLYENLAEKLTPQGLELIPGVLQAGMLLEVQAYYAEQGGTNSSDLKLATFELGLDGELNENIKGHALLLWEQDETEPLDLDEGFVTLGGSEQIPLSLTAGRLYLPFGAYYNLQPLHQRPADTGFGRNPQNRRPAGICLRIVRHPGRRVPAGPCRGRSGAAQPLRRIPDAESGGFFAIGRLSRLRPGRN